MKPRPSPANARPRDRRRPPGSPWARWSPPPRLAAALDAVGRPAPGRPALSRSQRDHRRRLARRQPAGAGRSPRSAGSTSPPGRSTPCSRRSSRRPGCGCASATTVIGTLQSPGVAGLFTAEQALAQLLAGTGVTYRFTDARRGDAASCAGTSEFVEVTGRAAIGRRRRSTPSRCATSRRRSPSSRSAVIEEQGATTLRDVLRNVPGITFQAGEGGVPAGDQLTIRGFSARTDIFVDGVRDFGGYSRDSLQPRAGRGRQGPGVRRSPAAARPAASINQVSKAPALRRPLRRHARRRQRRLQARRRSTSTSRSSGIAGDGRSA